jgi:hypothetical protein
MGHACKYAQGNGYVQDTHQQASEVLPLRPPWLIQLGYPTEAAAEERSQGVAERRPPEETRRATRCEDVDGGLIHLHAALT